MRCRTGWSCDPDFDIDNYSREIVTIFDLATRAKDTP